MRALAILFVIAGHYFLNTNFNQTPFDNPLLFVLGMLQTLTMIGVPLFLMLTGYLNLSKTQATRAYYKGIWRVLAAYLFFSIITILFRKYYLGQQKTILEWVHTIFSFEAGPYFWFIEMWIGLFILTPFLNKLWHAIETKRQRRILILTLFALSAIPSFTNRYGLHIWPGYWIDACYPLLAFYIGAYIRTYQPTFKTILLIGLISALCLFNPTASLLLSPAKPMLHLQGGTDGVVSIILSVCVFLLFYRTDLTAKPLRALITKISLLSLDMYLVAYIIDALVYPIWKHTLGNDQAQLAPYYIPIILSLLIATLLTAWAKEIIFTIPTLIRKS